MKENIFTMDDKVYHPIHGAGFVRVADKSDIPYKVAFKNTTCWCFEEHLSFEPWPAPVHVRPFKAGWWIAKSRGGADLRIVYSTSKTGGLVYCHYLGEKLPEEWNTEKGIV